MTSRKTQSATPTFEEDLARLEALADRMEGGDLSLDELLTAFEEGTILSQSLQERLAKAQARLHEVKPAKEGGVTVTPTVLAQQGSLLDDLEP